jgi:hypothetical protein
VNNAADNGATATGSVTNVSKVADTSTGVGTYAVTVSFTADPSKFLIGSTVTGAITTSQRNNVILVPALAVTTTSGRSTVTVATDGTLTGPTEVREVTTGQRSGAQVEITKGLAVGDKVVVEVPAAVANRTGAPTGASGAGNRQTGQTGQNGQNGQFPAGASGGGQFSGTGGQRRNSTGTGSTNG